MRSFKKFAAMLLSAAFLSPVPAVMADESASQPLGAEESAAATPEPDLSDLIREVSGEKEINGIRVGNEFISYRILATYISQLYIDETVSDEDAMIKGLSKYLEENPEALDALLKAMFSSLDDYSEFMTASEFDEYENAVDQTFYGLGISMRRNDEYVEIDGFLEEGGLAQRSGFILGDKIVKVNGQNVVGMSVNEIRNLIVGELGTTVNITVLRGEDTYVDLIGVRTEVRQSTVSGVILKQNIGYIKIASFGMGTADEFDKILADMTDKGVINIILDLRGNGGGRLEAAVKIAGMLVPKGKIVDVKYRDSKNDVTFNSNLAQPSKRLIVLVNEQTASASEILASAIQESGAGRLLGTQTFGKAVVQRAFTLGNKSVFKLTVGKYITRNGNEINGIGLTPDVYVANTREALDSTKYTKFDFQTKWAVGDSGTGVRAAKERLYILGYYTGNTDSDAFYADLQSAVKLFQLDEGLVPYGVIDIPTQVKLEARFEELDIYHDNQLEEAYKLFGGLVEDLSPSGDEQQ